MSKSRYMPKPLVINWHVLEACNYACGYCYAKYGGDDASVIFKMITKHFC